MSTRSYRVSRIIQAPPTVVWDLLTDAESYDSWNDAVISIHGPIQQGNTIELVSIVNPKRTFKLHVSEMRAPHHMTWSDGMPFGLFTGQRTFTISDRGDGKSEFEMVEEYTGPLSGLITKAIPDLTDSFEKYADGLKTAAEARTTS